MDFDQPDKYFICNACTQPIFRARKYYVMVKQTDTGALYSGHQHAILWQKLNFHWGIFEFLDIHRGPEGAKIGFIQLIIEFGALIVDL